MDDIVEIIQYGAKWDLDEHSGYLWLKDRLGEMHEEKVQSPEELFLLVHLLQTEEPIYYHAEDHYLSTSIEEVGDESHEER